MAFISASVGKQVLGVLSDEEAETKGVALCLATGVTGPGTGAGAWRPLALE